MDAAERRASRGHTLKALHYSDGLRIAMLPAKPVRLRNFVGTTIGKNLVKVGDVYHWRFEQPRRRPAKSSMLTSLSD